MKKFLKHITLCLVLLLPMTASAARSNIKISKASLKSSTIVMGDTTTLHVEVVLPKTTVSMFGLEMKDSLSSKVELGDLVKGDTIEVDQSHVRIVNDWIVQAYDSGKWEINPVFALSADTIRYDKALELNVKVVKVDEKGDIKDFAPIIDPNRKLLDYVPSWMSDYWWAWLLLLIAIAALVVYLKWWRKGKNPFKIEKKRKPAYEEAVERLQLLKAQQLWQKGQEKDYYTGLTDILREYIDRRFGINAVEMTSTQIMESLKNNPETKLVNDQLNEILAIADFVKFAGQHPLADDNERSFQRAENFVESTKPAPESESKEKKEGEK